MHKSTMSAYRQLAVATAMLVVVAAASPAQAADSWWSSEQAPPALGSASTRARKEAFVSFNNGTTFTEVSLIANVVPLGVAARAALDVYRGVKATQASGG
jgi:hypothetical protein